MGERTGLAVTGWCLGRGHAQREGRRWPRACRSSMPALACLVLCTSLGAAKAPPPVLSPMEPFDDRAIPDEGTSADLCRMVHQWHPRPAPPPGSQAAVGPPGTQCLALPGPEGGPHPNDVVVASICRDKLCAEGLSIPGKAQAPVVLIRVEDELAAMRRDFGQKTETSASSAILVAFHESPLVSVRQVYSGFTEGAAHAINFARCRTFDAVSGKRLSLDELVGATAVQQIRHWLHWVKTEGLGDPLGAELDPTSYLLHRDARGLRLILCATPESPEGDHVELQIPGVWRFAE